MTKITKRLYLFAGMLFVGTAVFNIVLWIIVSANYMKSLDVVKAEYLAWYPSFLHDSRVISYLNLGCCIAALYCIHRSVDLKRIIPRLLFVFTWIITVWMLFSLM